MNVRFAPGQVRFRITRDELERLKAGRALALNVALPGRHAFQASITPDRFGAWRLDNDPTGLWLTVPQAAVAGFDTGLPTAEGLEHAFDLADGGQVGVAFEVDVRA